MVSPGDPISERIKPFVFLDGIAGPVASGTGLGWHPHSGIATLTYALDADVAYEDTAGQQGVVRLLLGHYGESSNPIPTPSPLLSLDVVLAAGQTWSFLPPSGHNVAWIYVYRGEAQVAGEAVGDELVVLAPGDGAIAITALQPAGLLLGSGVQHNHPLVLGSHSVHTSREALARGLQGIATSKPTTAA